MGSGRGRWQQLSDSVQRPGTWQALPAPPAGLRSSQRSRWGCAHLLQALAAHRSCTRCGAVVAQCSPDSVRMLLQAQRPVLLSHSSGSGSSSGQGSRPGSQQPQAHAVSAGAAAPVQDESAPSGRPREPHAEGADLPEQRPAKRSRLGTRSGAAGEPGLAQVRRAFGMFCRHHRSCPEGLHLEQPPWIRIPVAHVHALCCC